MAFLFTCLQSTRSARRDGLAWAGLLVYGLIVGVALAHHEIWRDEAQAWLIAVYSESPLVLWQRIADESHPALWYLLLWPVSRLSHDVAALQAVQAVVSAGYAALLLFAAPFTRCVRLLIVSGYFLIYEYAVISRSYGLETLLIFAACAVFERRSPSARIMLSAALVLLANTSAFGAVFAIAFVVAWLIDFIRAHYPGSSRDESPRDSQHRLLQWLSCVSVVAAAVVFSVYQMFRNPAAVPHLEDGLHGASHVQALATPLAELGAAILPIFDFTHVAFWNNNGLLHGASAWGPGVLIATALLTVAVVTVALWRYPVVWCFFVCALVGLLGLRVLAHYPFEARHYGHGWILLIATAWLYQHYRRQSSNSLPSSVRRTLGVAALSVAALHSAVGLTAVVYDWRYPFSAGQDIASVIAKDRTNNAPVFEQVDPFGTPVAAYLDQPLFAMRTGQFTGPIDWMALYDQPEGPNISRILQARLAPGGAGYLITRGPFRPADAQLTTTLLFEPKPSIVPTEAQYLYRVVRASGKP